MHNLLFTATDTTPAVEHRRLVGRNLRDHRARCGLSQTELSVLLDLDRRQLSEWERGVCTPSARHLERLADALDCHWTAFYRRRD